MKCKNCGELIQGTDFGRGTDWEHVGDGHPHVYCRTAPVAEPDTVGAWATQLLDPQPRHAA